MVLSGLQSSSLVSLGQLCDDSCVIGLDSQRLVAIKNKKVVLVGKRNLRDGFWDIPTYKDSLTSKNHCMPTAHPGMYRLWNSVSPTTPGMRTSPRTNTPKIHSAYHINNINTTASQKIIDIQLKKDAKEQLQRVDINDSHHSMAVIVRKTSNKKELIQYLHATCISPSNATYVKAIKNNNFITWPGLTKELVTKHLPHNPKGTGAHAS